MRWAGRRQSENVEDRRGIPAAGMVGGGLGTMLLVLVLALVFKIDPRQFLAQQQQGGAPAGEATAEQQEMKEFVSVVLADTEDVWHEQFQRIGRQYRVPHLVLFDRAVESACGLTGSAVGPLWCATDDREMS